MITESKTVSIKKAVIINFLGKYCNIFIQLIYSAILARLLSPEDFGIVAVIAVFTSFFSLIADMGIGPAVIQNVHMDEKDISSIFSLTVYAGVAVAIAFTLFSIPLSTFYNNHVFIPIGSLLAISLFFNTINIVPNALLLKAHKFRMVSIRMVIVTISSAIPTIILAYIGFQYYAIIINSILISLFTYIWNYYTVRPKFTLRFQVDSINKIRNYSGYQMAFSVINYFSRNMDNLLIGKFLGNAALGFYDKSYRLMLYPVQNLTHVITPVLHPILSLHQSDKDYIYAKYIKVIKVLSLLGTFVSAYSFFSAEEIVVLLYGKQWDDAILSFRILSLSIWAQMVTSSTGSIFQSIGNTKLLFKSGAVSAFVIVGSILSGIRFGDINMVAVCVSLAYNIIFFVTFCILIGKGFEKPVRIFFKKFLPDFIIFVIVFIGLYFISFFSIHSLILSGLIKLLFGGIIYIAAMAITKQFQYFKDMFTG